MSISNTDIIFVLSGGPNNANANLSLGGPPSQYPILTTSLNSVFSDISVTDSQFGLIDYRCIYVVNNNAISSLYNTGIYLGSVISGSSNIMIGLTIPTINNIAYFTSSAIMAPNDISFSLPTVYSPISLGTLPAKAYFPVWIKRTTPPNTMIVRNDGFILTITGTTS
jgi:hypothetical protein